MDPSLFFDSDKILVSGKAFMNEEQLEAFRSNLLTGVFVARPVSDSIYLVTVNKYVEHEIRKIDERGGKNLRSRSYKLLECREPSVVDAAITRILTEPAPATWNYGSWYNTLLRGIFYDTSTEPMLDHMVFLKRIRYESDATYCLSETFINPIIQKEEHFNSQLERYLDCRDEEILNLFMDRLGFTPAGGKYVKKTTSNNTLSMIWDGLK